MSDYKPGSRWKSAVCSGEFVVVRAPAIEGELGCGGRPLARKEAKPLPASD